MTVSRLLRCSSTASNQSSWNKRHCRKRSEPVSAPQHCPLGIRCRCGWRPKVFAAKNLIGISANGNCCGASKARVRAMVTLPVMMHVGPRSSPPGSM